MSIKWLVQDTDRAFLAIENEFLPLKQLGYEVVPFGVIPFTKQITGIDDIDFETSTFIIRGGTKIVGMLYDGIVDNLSPENIAKLAAGISYNKNKFDQAYYSNLGLPLLNDHPLILDLNDPRDLLASFDKPKFVKPSSDLKAFTAGIMEPENTIKNFVESNYHRSGYKEESALVHNVVHIDAEYRFFCLNGEVITGSLYRKNDVLTISNVIDKIVLDTADEYAKLYIPSEIYTMDLAETPNGIKIVEYNCWNGSGLYAVDAIKLFSTVQDYYEGK